MDALTRANLEFERTHPGDSGVRQPVHVVYGGAHLFKAGLARRIGDIALKTLEEYAPDAASLGEACGVPVSLAPVVHERVVAKLRREPVEDLRLDFEDGYGYRPDEEEDAAARAAAVQLAIGREQGTLPVFIGIRIKALTEESKARSLRTLRLVLGEMGNLPEHFTVTLPKVTVPEQVAACAEALAEFGVKRLEFMVETPQSLFLLPELVEASRGLCVAAHFGAYDYTAALGIAAEHQDMLHPACDFARSMMQARLAGTGIHVSDGATNLLPIPPHRGEAVTELQRADNREAMYQAWRMHSRHIRHGLRAGFYQGWDLHPAQLISRYAAVYSFFLEGLRESSARLRNFIARAAQATQVGGVFDDAATGQGLLNYFLRATGCGAIPESDVPALTGLTVDELRSASFAKILKGRSTHGL
jgi:citrate lyase beta subunit